ncbi:MAG: Ig-like domain-containing protein [Gemmatimonadota bacterium]|nr:Ig-like domain-containing protein [Gemmatimonadota bacterium]
MSSAPRWIATCVVTGWALAGCEDTPTPPPEPEPEPVLAAIEMRPPERHFGMLGGSILVSARQIAEDGSTIPTARRFPVRFAWSTDAPEVATVSDSGRVTSVGEGTANITATSEGFSGCLSEVLVLPRTLCRHMDCPKHAWGA